MKLYKILKVALFLYLGCNWIHNGYNQFRMIVMALIAFEMYVIYELNLTSQDLQKSD
jgi:hypothetical protein